MLDTLHTKALDVCLLAAHLFNEAMLFITCSKYTETPMSDPLELELWMVVSHYLSSWDLNLHPMQKQ